MSEPASLTYAEVGATRKGPLPEGYRTMRHRTLLGTGPVVMREAADAVLEFWMHRGAGARVQASAVRAAPGVRVVSTLGLGPFRVSAPCEVVWAEEGERRAGFGYGTLPGHPARGEEAFIVERDDMDDVWITIVAFSLPSSRLMRALGPLAPVFQKFFARRCGAVLRRLVR